MSMLLLIMMIMMMFLAAGSQKRHLWDPTGGLLQLLMARQLQLLSVCLSKDVIVHKNVVSKASDYCKITLLQNYSKTTFMLVKKVLVYRSLKATFVWVFLPQGPEDVRGGGRLCYVALNSTKSRRLLWALLCVVRCYQLQCWAWSLYFSVLYSAKKQVLGGGMIYVA